MHFGVWSRGSSHPGRNTNIFGLHYTTLILKPPLILVAKHLLGVMANLSYAMFLAQLSKFGMEKGFSSQAAEGLGDSSNYIALKGASQTLGAGQRKHLNYFWEKISTDNDLI